jgi:glycerol-3-phosphate acyltransferase PlsY
MDSSFVTQALAVLAAYLLGSVPFAVVVSKAFRLDDPRSYGSGNPGATNVLRTGNKLAALLTLLGDSLKGAAAILLARAAGLDEATTGLVALAVFAGHLFPVFLGFKGGKGVATAAGVLLALAPWLGLAVLGTWLVVAVVFRYSSLAAISAAALAPLYVGLVQGLNGLFMVSAILALALIAKHGQNIQRLLAGQESRIGSKKKAA